MTDFNARRLAMLNSGPGYTQQAYNPGDAGWSGVGGQQAAQFTQQANGNAARFNANLGAGSSGGASGVPSDAERIANAYKQQFALTQGRGEALGVDPYVTAALQKLQAQMATGPLGTTEVNQIAANNAESTAASAGSQAEMARGAVEAGGGNINDPAFQERLRQIEQNRQSSNSSMLGNLQTTAATTNYNAEGNAAQQLAATRGAQNAQINQMYGQAAQLYNMQTAAGPHNSAVSVPVQRSGGFSYNPYAPAASTTGGGGDPYMHSATPTHPPGSPSNPGNVGMNWQTGYNGAVETANGGAPTLTPWNQGGYNGAEPVGGTSNPNDPEAAYYVPGETSGQEQSGFEYNPTAGGGSYGRQQQVQNWTQEDQPAGLRAQPTQATPFKYRPATAAQPRF